MSDLHGCLCLFSVVVPVFWCLAAFNYLRTCHKIRWLLVEDNMKHEAVSAGPSMINNFCWWFHPITFQSREACVGHNWKLLLISMIFFFIDISSPSSTSKLSLVHWLHSCSWAEVLFKLLQKKPTWGWFTEIQRSTLSKNHLGIAILGGPT